MFSRRLIAYALCRRHHGTSSDIRLNQNRNRLTIIWVCGCQLVLDGAGLCFGWTDRGKHKQTNNINTIIIFSQQKLAQDKTTGIVTVTAVLKAEFGIIKAGPGRPTPRRAAANQHPASSSNPNPAQIKTLLVLLPSSNPLYHYHHGENFKQVQRDLYTC